MFDKDEILKARILMVDDEGTNIAVLETVLKQAKYTSISSTTDSREAASLYQKLKPDLVLLDLRMPHVDGFEVIAKLQEDPVWRHIPVIVITAKDLESGESTYLAKHVEKVVQKGGLDPSGLAQAVRDAVG